MVAETAVKSDSIHQLRHYSDHQWLLTNTVWEGGGGGGTLGKSKCEESTDTWSKSAVSGEYDLLAVEKIYAKYDDE